MSTFRKPKVVITNYRAAPPPAAGRGFPLERELARPGAVASQHCWDKVGAAAKKEAAEHDRAVVMLSEETLLAVAADLGIRRPSNRRDPEERWLMGRKAAVLRRLMRERDNLSPLLRS
jgi:hypothetical protein